MDVSAQTARRLTSLPSDPTHLKETSMTLHGHAGRTSDSNHLVEHQKYMEFLSGQGLPLREVLLQSFHLCCCQLGFQFGQLGIPVFVRHAAPAGGQGRHCYLDVAESGITSNQNVCFAWGWFSEITFQRIAFQAYGAFKKCAPPANY